MPAVLFFIDILALTLDPFAPVAPQIYYEGQKLEHHLSNVQFRRVRKDWCFFDKSRVLFSDLGGGALH
jgi:hypothetical protein